MPTAIFKFSDSRLKIEIFQTSVINEIYHLRAQQKRRENKLNAIFMFFILSGSRRMEIK
jgi:hypothetical protein